MREEAASAKSKHFSFMKKGMFARSSTVKTRIFLYKCDSVKQTRDITCQRYPLLGFKVVFWKCDLLYFKEVNQVFQMRLRLLAELVVFSLHE